MGPCGSGKQFTCLATFYILTVYKSYCQFYVQVIFNSKACKWFRFPQLSARHQFTLRDHGSPNSPTPAMSHSAGVSKHRLPPYIAYYGYGHSVSHGVSVHSLAFTGSLVLILPAPEGRPDWVNLDGWLNTKMVQTQLEPANGHPSQYAEPSPQKC